MDQFYWTFADEFSGYGETIAVIVAVVIGVVMLASMIQIAAYVLESIALFQIAKTRGINGYGWAWAPVGKAWVLGKIADQFLRKKSDRDMQLGKILLILELIYYGIAFLYGIVMEVFVFSTAFLGAGETFTVAVVLALVGIFLLMFAGAAAVTAVYYVALYQVYASCMPSKTVLLLILSAIFPTLGKAICLVAVHQKDEGFLEQIARDDRMIAQTNLSQTTEN